MIISRNFRSFNLLPLFSWPSDQAGENKTHYRLRPPLTQTRLSRMCHPDEISLVVALKRALLSDARNVAAVCTVDHAAEFKPYRIGGAQWWHSKEQNLSPDMHSDKPFALLRQEGKEGIGGAKIVFFYQGCCPDEPLTKFSRK